MKKTVLLTGASGTVGRGTLAELLKRTQRFNIRVFDLDTTRNRKYFKRFRSQIEVYYGDLCEPQDLVPATTGVDCVIHLAALLPPVADREPTLTKAINSDGTLNLLQALETYSPSAFFIYSSSVSLYGDRLEDPWINVEDPYQPNERDYYAVTKKMAEDHIQRSNLDWTIFRLSCIFDAAPKKDPLLFHMPLTTSLEFTTAWDTGFAMAEALDNKDKLNHVIFNLGGGPSCRLTFKEFLDQGFEQYGLGKNFLPDWAFAEKHFHCGYYQDSYILNDILHFQRDTKEGYFQRMRGPKGPVVRSLTRISRPIVRWSLIRQSEPWQAIRKRDVELMERFYDESKILSLRKSSANQPRSKRRSCA